MLCDCVTVVCIYFRCAALKLCFLCCFAFVFSQPTRQHGYNSQVNDVCVRFRSYYYYSSWSHKTISHSLYYYCCCCCYCCVIVVIVLLSYRVNCKKVICFHYGWWSCNTRWYFWLHEIEMANGKWQMEIIIAFYKCECKTWLKDITGVSDWFRA